MNVGAARRLATAAAARHSRHWRHTGSWSTAAHAHATAPRPVLPHPSHRVIIAVSGTLQDGFELRGNLDFPGGAPALLLGFGVARGCKMYFDIKDVGCREHDAAAPHKVNPAVVLSGDRLDANQYALCVLPPLLCVGLRLAIGAKRACSSSAEGVRWLDLAPCWYQVGLGRTTHANCCAMVTAIAPLQRGVTHAACL